MKQPDFILFGEKTKNSTSEMFVMPKFIVKKSSDLMIRGGTFYAIWDDENGAWSTDIQRAQDIIDTCLQEYAEKRQTETMFKVVPMFLWDSGNRQIKTWHTYVNEDMCDNYVPLDEKIIFQNDVIKKENYSSKRVSYPLLDGPHPAYDRLMSVLYADEERKKIEWAIGSIVNGDSKKLQKFVVLYGSHGTGKSTIINIIDMLFNGYISTFDAKSLGMTNESFALEAFRNNPLIAVQHDGDLSRIEDNTKLNSLVSHETMIVNEKHKSTYEMKFKAFLFMGTNKPVRITDAKSGLIRRLIDVTPTGNLLPIDEYTQIFEQIPFELGAIAAHCKHVYEHNKHFYDKYEPTSMMEATNDFYNFMLEKYFVFSDDNSTTLRTAWDMYKEYIIDANVPYPMSMKAFKEELKNYFEEYVERGISENGTRIRNLYSGFKKSIFEKKVAAEEPPTPSNLPCIEFSDIPSIFDKAAGDYPAQYGNADEKPYQSWDNVTTTLSDIDTHQLHYVRVPLNHIVIDFDIKDEDGDKSFEKNLEAASRWPATYAELSKSGKGIHLHYIYTGGDPSKLSALYADNIEIKVFVGRSSLRRKLTKCNNLPIAEISSGLPMKEEKMQNFTALKNEKALRTIIVRNLRKEIHSSTKCSVDFICKAVEDAYNSGIPYDISDMRNDITLFALSSTNQSEACVKAIEQIHWQSESNVPTESNDDRLVFYDCEVFPNLFLINWKFEGSPEVHRMINPSKDDVADLTNYKLVGFNCRRYDNHILYARMLGYNNLQLYNLSQKIVTAKKGQKCDAFFGNAYNLSYTDIYDFASSGNKKSLKKFEIELGIKHLELGFPWDQPVPEEKWQTVAEYCDNDVISTEAVFNHLRGDWTARCILADIADMTVNDTTNSLTTKIIFGSNKTPQGEFEYRFMGTLSDDDTFAPGFDEYVRFNRDGKPVFPGYRYEYGKSTYRGEEVGEGGYVYAEPGMYTKIALLDITSMHPSSTIAEELFGPRYTARYADIKNARVLIKHQQWDELRKIFDGKLSKYVDKVIAGEMKAKELSNALKTAINSVYGLTAASFDNPFRPHGNVDNIVAKRGALFMINLKYEVQKRGYTVVHIKTDSIKIADATPEIIEFVQNFGRMYGYKFEHEATYEKMCIVNDAVYIAKYVPEFAEDGHLWTATGTQFAVPFVFKTWFSKEPVELNDLTITNEVSTALYLDDGNEKQFIGKIGEFVPIPKEKGGKQLLRANTAKDGSVKYDAAVGTKGYYWLEAEKVRESMTIGDVDRSYFIKLADDAKAEISKYGDFEWFVA